MRPNHTVRRAVKRDAALIFHLQKKFTDELGFIPREAVLRRIERQEVSIALENDEAAGFLLTAAALSKARQIRPIFQAAVAMDAQRRHLGLALLDELTRTAVASRQTMLQCFCRQSLDANAFWKAAGFIAVGLRDVGAARSSPCILWRKPLVITTADALSVIPANPHNHAAAGRSVARFAWDKLPAIDHFSHLDINRELERLNLCA